MIRQRRMARAPGRPRSAAPTTVSTWARAMIASNSRSHTASAGITPEQRSWRDKLVGAMRKQGFVNYAREWWHFSYARSGGAPTQDFPIRPYQAKPNN